MNHRLLPRVTLAVFTFIAVPLALEGVLRIAKASRGKVIATSDVVPPGQPGELRIFAYGESIVHGAPEPSIGFIAQLRFALQRVYPLRTVRVVNFSLTGGFASETADRMASTIDQEPDLVIIMSGGNDGVGNPPPPDWIESIASRSLLLRTSERIAHGVQSRLRSDTLVNTSRRRHLLGTDRRDRPARVARLRRVINSMLDLAKERGIPVLLCTEPANIRDMPPLQMGLPNGGPYGGSLAYRRTLKSIDSALAARRMDEADTLLGPAMRFFPDDATLLYLEGKIQYGKGNYVAAGELFTRAKEFDQLAWRMLDEFNDAIRDVARRPGVHLVDVDRLFKEHSEGESPGFDLFADNSHPTPLGGALIAATLVAQVRALFPEGSLSAKCCDVDEFLRATNFHGSAREVAYYLRLGKYLMKPPWSLYVVSREYLNDALAVAPSNWEIWANLATVSLLQGNVATGEQELRKAVELKGSPLDPDDRAATPYLNEAMRSIPPI